jgi:PAS domain S-box-containing protein
MAERLEAAEARFRLAAIVESSEDAIVGLTLDGTVISWNRSACQMYGYSAQEMVGKSISLLFPPEDPGEKDRLLAKFRRGESIKQWETVRVRKDGQRISVSLTVSRVRDATGQLIGLSAIARDITERKHAEAALRESEERFRAIFDNAANAIAVGDLQGRCVMANKAACNFIGRRLEEVIGLHIDDIVYPEDRHLTTHLFPSLITGAVSSYTVERRYLRKDGAIVWGQASVSLIRDEDGKPKYLMGVMADITARKRAEQALQQAMDELAKAKDELDLRVQERTAELAEKIAELQAFSYSLSHDMRAPLRAISIYSEVILSDFGPKLEPPATQYLQKIISSSARLDRLIQDVLLLSRISQQTIRLRRVDIERLLHEIIQERPELHAPGVKISLESPLVPVMGHEASLTQCFTNLLGNAVKFVPRGIQPKVNVRTQLLSNTVRVWVEDNGLGIPAHAHTKIFEIFQRLHKQDEYEGTGIGLAIVRKAVERMGGCTGVESELGKGSRFWLELKAVESAGKG